MPQQRDAPSHRQRAHELPATGDRDRTFEPRYLRVEQTEIGQRVAVVGVRCSHRRGNVGKVAGNDVESLRQRRCATVKIVELRHLRVRATNPRSPDHQALGLTRSAHSERNAARRLTASGIASTIMRASARAAASSARKRSISSESDMPSR